MPDKIKIALDAMGGDYGPEVVVSAAALASQSRSGLSFLFSGDQRLISEALERYPALKDTSEIIHTSVVISNDEKPSSALRSGKNSSMRMALDAAREGKAACAVSAGNTGALMAMAMFVFKPLEGIHRPAIASIFPTTKNDIVMLDLGANLECDTENLVQFAILGSVYAKMMSSMKSKPTVGLLNIGKEALKGKESIREAGAILKDLKFSGGFKGFIEGDDIPLGKVDVVVTDGFTGNVALKVAEGMGVFSGHLIREAFMSSLWAKLGGLLAFRAMKRLKKRVDPRFYNGGMFLGLNGICVKSHGSSDAYGFSRAILLAAELAGHDYVNMAAAEIASLSGQAHPVPEDKTAGTSAGS
jgi:glycerol-3-phosphate acyltransferase PlsX